MTTKILVFAGSVRKGAFSQHMADAAAKELEKQGARVTQISLRDYPLPIMDEDLQNEHGIPEPAMQLARIIAKHDGLMICSPEYNASIPPLLKNSLDWVSRISKDGDAALKPFTGLTAALCSTSNGAFAGIRALYHLRAVLMAVGAQVLTEQCSVSGAANAFDADNTIKDARSQRALANTCRSLIESCQLRPSS